MMSWLETMDDNLSLSLCVQFLNINKLALGTTSITKEIILNGHCPYGGGGVGPCPVVLVLFFYQVMVPKRGIFD